MIIVLTLFSFIFSLATNTAPENRIMLDETCINKIAEYCEYSDLIWFANKALGSNPLFEERMRMKIGYLDKKIGYKESSHRVYFSYEKQGEEEKRGQIERTLSFLDSTKESISDKIIFLNAHTNLLESIFTELKPCSSNGCSHKTSRYLGWFPGIGALYDDTYCMQRFDSIFRKLDPSKMYSLIGRTYHSLDLHILSLDRFDEYIEQFFPNEISSYRTNALLDRRSMQLKLLDLLLSKHDEYHEDIQKLTTSLLAFDGFYAFYNDIKTELINFFVKIVNKDHSKKILNLMFRRYSSESFIDSLDDQNLNYLLSHNACRPSDEHLIRALNFSTKNMVSIILGNKEYHWCQRKAFYTNLINQLNDHVLPNLINYQGRTWVYLQNTGLMQSMVQDLSDERIANLFIHWINDYDFTSPNDNPVMLFSAFSRYADHTKNNIPNIRQSIIDRADIQKLIEIANTTEIMLHKFDPEGKTKEELFDSLSL